MILFVVKRDLVCVEKELFLAVHHTVLELSRLVERVIVIPFVIIKV